MLRARVITALLLVAGLALVLFVLPPPAVAAAFALIAALAGWEWAGMMRQSSCARIVYAVVIAILCWPLYTMAESMVPLLLAMAVAFWFLAAPLWLWRRWVLTRSKVTGYAVGMILLLATWAAMLVLHSANPWLLLAVMALVWVADIGAYFSGRRFGRRKLAPAISPGKTWEGVAGGVVAVLVYAWAVLYFTPLGARIPLPGMQTALLLLVLAALSVSGDLFESLLKRQAQIKDSSQLLPGHGGILDRIDSLTSTLPLAALLMLVWR